MSNSRRQFIEDNREKLQTYSSKMNNDTCHVFGFGCHTPVEVFEAILEGTDDFYLPLCFLYIFWEFDNVEDRTFVLNSLKCLHITDEDGEIPDPVIAYVYAYCLCLTDEDDQSYDLLIKLAEQCFPPALATMGDGCIAHHNIKGAIAYYSHAIEHGYLAVTPRTNVIVINDAPFLKSLFLRCVANLKKLPLLIKLILKGMKGEHTLYLDFYIVSHHLNKYWETPKAKRIQKLRET